MHPNDQALLEHLIVRLRELEDMNIHEHNRAILDVARGALLDAIGALSISIEAGRRAREDRGRPPPPDSGDTPMDPKQG